jgi:hypothetical protein
MALLWAANTEVHPLCIQVFETLVRTVREDGFIPLIKGGDEKTPKGVAK